MGDDRTGRRTRTGRQPAPAVSPQRAGPASRWIVRFRPRPDARARLFCLPYAGAGASVYRGWPAQLPPDVELCAVQLPGREGRHDEPLFTDVRALAGAVCEGIAALCDRPFVVFGHSLGALLAYEAALLLERAGGPSPALLVVSGHRAPHLPRTHPPIHHLPDAEFIDELRRLNGTPSEVFDHPELLALVLPPLRADLRMAETYVAPPPAPLACPILAVGSTGDDRVSEAAMDAWRIVTAGPFTAAMLPGDHFYLKSHGGLLLDLLRPRLTALPR